MKCKFCQAELESNSSVCPNCHKDNLKDNLQWLKVTALVLVCLVLLVLLVGMINYGVTGSFMPDWFKPSEGNTETTGKNENNKVLTPAGLKEMNAEELDEAMDKVVLTMGEYKMTNRDLQLYYWVSAQNNKGKADLTKDLTTQVYDETTGQSYHDYFLEEAVLMWKEIMMMSDAAKKANYEMDQEYKDYLDGMEEDLQYYVDIYVSYYGYDLDGVDDLIRMEFGPGSNYETYYNYTYNYYYGALYWEEMIGDLEVTEEEINQYFDENEESLATDYDIPVTKDFGNLADMRNILIEAVVIEKENESGEKIKITDWEKTLEKAQAVYDAWMAGEMTEEAFIELVKAHSKDENAATGGLYEDLYPASMMKVDVRHILIFPEGATSSTVTSQTWPDSAWAYAENKAKEILAQWEAGEKTEDSFGALANEHSADQNGKVTNGGLYEDVYIGQMVANFEDWCFDSARQTGDVGIVKTEYGYHVMYYVRADRAAADWCFDEARQVGDVGMVQTDDGYMLMYFKGADPAWYRYSRYGAQAENAQEMLDAMIAEFQAEIDKDQVVIGMLQ